MRLCGCAKNGELKKYYRYLQLNSFSFLRLNNSQNAYSAWQAAFERWKLELDSYNVCEQQAKRVEQLLHLSRWFTCAKRDRRIPKVKSGRTRWQYEYHRVQTAAATLKSKWRFHYSHNIISRMQLTFLAANCSCVAYVDGRCSSELRLLTITLPLQTANRSAVRDSEAV